MHPRPPDCDRMKHVRRFWLQGVLALCAVATIGLLIWPAGSADLAPAPPAERYSGPDLQTRRGGPVPGFAIRLSSATDSAAAAPPPVEALPVLVGIAGRQAYLRSAATGEVERVSIGQEIDGWRLVSVGARSANLRGASGDKRIEMFSVPADPVPFVAPQPTPGAPGQPTSGG